MIQYLDMCKGSISGYLQGFNVCLFTWIFLRIWIFGNLVAWMFGKEYFWTQLQMQRMVQHQKGQNGDPLNISVNDMFGYVDH